MRSLVAAGLAPAVASTLGVAYAPLGPRRARGWQLARQAVADAERMRLTVDKAGLLCALDRRR